MGYGGFYEDGMIDLLATTMSYPGKVAILNKETKEIKC